MINFIFNITPIIFFYRLLIGNVFADFNILDYSNSRLITIQNGIARKQNGTFKVIHSIDLEQYRILSQDIESILNTNITYNSPLRPFLKQQVFDINGLLRRLSPHIKKRSLDFIGSAWKWVAGTPDSHDFEILNQKTNNILENNNRQMIINELTASRIQDISNITNEILKAKREDWKGEITNTLEHKLTLIEKELQNIEYAIQWAKVDIVNSFILSKTEIENLNYVLENYNIPIFNIDELLSFSSVKIVTNNKEILYILSIPITQNDICKTFLAKPVKNGNLIDKIEYDKILDCNDNLFAIKGSCKSYNALTICNRDKLVELSDKFCITSLFKNKVGNCTQVNNEHVPAVEEIASDLLMLNQYMGIIQVNKEAITLNGTFLVRFFNTTVNIEGREYFSKEISGKKPLPAPLQPKAWNSKTEEIISLQSLQKLNVGNIKRLEILEIKNDFILISTIIFVIIICATIGWNYWKKFRKQKETLEIKEVQTEHPNAIKTTEEKIKKKNTTIYDIHAF